MYNATALQPIVDSSGDLRAVPGRLLSGSATKNSVGCQKLPLVEVAEPDVNCSVV